MFLLRLLLAAVSDDSIQSKILDIYIYIYIYIYCTSIAICNCSTIMVKHIFSDVSIYCIRSELQLLLCLLSLQIVNYIAWFNLLTQIVHWYKPCRELFATLHVIADATWICGMPPSILLRIQWEGYGSLLVAQYKEAWKHMSLHIKYRFNSLLGCCCLLGKKHSPLPQPPSC